MLTIRQGQWQAFERDYSERFVERLLARAKAEFPEEFEDLGEAGMESQIRQSIVLAERYKIESEPGIWVYLWLCLLYGPNFDLEPELPWAARILTSTGFASERERVEALLDASQADLARRAAAGDEYVAVGNV